MEKVDVSALKLLNESRKLRLKMSFKMLFILLIFFGSVEIYICYKWGHSVPELYCYDGGRGLFFE